LPPKARALVRPTETCFLAVVQVQGAKRVLNTPTYCSKKDIHQNLNSQNLNSQNLKLKFTKLNMLKQNLILATQLKFYDSNPDFGGYTDGP
jgi:hypothetical protein